MKKIIYIFIFLLPFILISCEKIIKEETTTETQPLEIIDTSNLIASENYTSVSVYSNYTNETFIHGVVRKVNYNSMKNEFSLSFAGGDKYCGIDDPEEYIDKLRLLTLDELGVNPIIYFTSSHDQGNKQLYCKIKYITINELLFKYDNLNYVINITMDFHQNKINANNKYIGKSIGIIGKIEGVEYIKFEGQERPTVIIEPLLSGEIAGKIPKINCYLSSEEEAIKLKRGSVIVIAGIFNSYIENEKGSSILITSNINPCKILDVTK